MYLNSLTHTVIEDRPEDQPAYLSNGLIGLRVAKIPIFSDTATVNGFTSFDRTAGVESVAPVPYPLGMDLRIGHVWLTRRPGRLRFIEQTYDFACGELRSRFAIDYDGIHGQVEVITLCSRTQPTIAAQSIQVQVDRACELIVRAQVDPTTVPGRLLEVVSLPAAMQSDTAAIYWGSEDGASRLGMAFAVRAVGAHATVREAPGWEPTQAICRDTQFATQPGEICRLEMFTSLVVDLLHQAPHQQAIRLVGIAQTLGFDGLRAANQAAWAELWKGRVLLHGAGEQWQSNADACFYYLHASVHPAMPANTGLFGLARWRNYHYFNGHAFWDLETFALPPLLFTDPGSARAMLEYRFRHLDAAQRNAALNGWRGMQFPWQSSPRTGEETTPVSARHVMYEQHVSLDVAEAFALFADVTGDKRFLRERAWPVLQGVADWLASRVTRTPWGAEILGVTGIDEGLVNVNNNSYTNLLAQKVLRQAVLAAERLGEEGVGAWQILAEQISLSYLPGTRILNKHEGFGPGPGGLCPDPLAAFFPQGCAVDPQVEQETIRYYLNNLTGYIGFPMLSAPAGVFAARLGDRALSARLFEQGVASYMFDPYLLVDEWGGEFAVNKERVGPYLAHAGGFLTGLLYGLPGLQVNPGEPETWAARPVVLPEGWEAIEIERLWVRDRPARLLARHGMEKAMLEFNHCER